MRQSLGWAHISASLGPFRHFWQLPGQQSWRAPTTQPCVFYVRANNASCAGAPEQQFNYHHKNASGFDTVTSPITDIHIYIYIC